MSFGYRFNHWLKYYPKSKCWRLTGRVTSFKLFKLWHLASFSIIAFTMWHGQQAFKVWLLRTFQFFKTEMCWRLGRCRWLNWTSSSRDVTQKASDRKVAGREFGHLTQMPILPGLGIKMLLLMMIMMIVMLMMMMMMMIMIMIMMVLLSMMMINTSTQKGPRSSQLC